MPSSTHVIYAVVFCVLVFAAWKVIERLRKPKQDGTPKGPTKDHPTK